MHARITTVKGSPDQVDQGLSFVEDQVLPRAKEADGFKGIVNLASRITGVVLTISFWETEDDLEASRELGKELRSEGSEKLGVDVVSVEEYEAQVAGDTLTLEQS